MDFFPDFVFFGTRRGFFTRHSMLLQQQMFKPMRAVTIAAATILQVHSSLAFNPSSFVSLRKEVGSRSCTFEREIVSTLRRGQPWAQLIPNSFAVDLSGAVVADFRPVKFSRASFSMMAASPKKISVRLSVVGFVLLVLK